MAGYSFVVNTQELVAALSSTTPFVVKPTPGQFSRANYVEAFVIADEGEDGTGSLELSAQSHIGCAKLGAAITSLVVNDDDQDALDDPIYFSPSDMTVIAQATRTDDVKITYDPQGSRPLMVQPYAEGKALNVRKSALSVVDPAVFEATGSAYGSGIIGHSVVLSGVDLIEAVSDAKAATSSKSKVQYLGIHLSTQTDSQHLLITGSNGGSRIVQSECVLEEPAQSEIAARVDPKLIGALAPAIESHRVELAIGAQRELRVFALGEDDDDVLSEFYIESMTLDVDNDSRVVAYPEAMMSKKVAQIEALPSMSITVDGRTFAQALAQTARVAATDGSWREKRHITLSFNPDKDELTMSVACRSEYSDTIEATGHDVPAPVSFIIKQDDIANVMLARVDRGEPVTLPIAIGADSVDNPKPRFVLLSEGSYKAVIALSAK